MATYVIGDIQGCYTPLRHLLDKIRFDPAQDQLWFAGDLVSRGKESLQALRYIKSLGDSAVSVLGNHDISLIAAAYGVIKPHKSLKKLMAAQDFDELLHWLRQQPLLHHDASHHAIMVHAGIPPCWKLKTAMRHASEVSNAMQQTEPREWLETIYGDKPDLWNPDTPPDAIEGQRYTVNALTRMRYCDPSGRLEFRQKLHPDTTRKTHPALTPWFLHPERKKIKETLYFGHWSTLGHYRANGVVALDTGCVWGGKLTAVCIDDSQLHSIECS